MKKRILKFLFAAIYFLAPALVLARDYGLEDTAGSQGAGYATEGTHANLFSIIGQIVGVLLALLAVIFVLIIIYAGIRWMTSRDNEELVKKAKNAMEAAVIGLAIIIAAYAVSNFVIGRLTA